MLPPGATLIGQAGDRRTSNLPQLPPMPAGRRGSVETSRLERVEKSLAALKQSNDALHKRMENLCNMLEGRLEDNRFSA